MEKEGPSVSLSTVIGILFAVLLILGLGSTAAFLWGNFRSTNEKKLAAAQAQEELRAGVKEKQSAALAKEIFPIILPCRFTYFKSCVKKIVSTQRVDDEPERDTYEEFALQDVFQAIQSQQNSALKNFSAPLTPEQVEKYFPERAKLGEDTDTPVNASLALTRVAANHNINARVLITLMEVMHNAQGPVMSDKASPTEPFFSDPKDYITQLEQVASELRSLHTEYVLQQKDKNALPRKLTFFERDYVVGEGVTPEDLALVTFIARHSSSQPEFQDRVWGGDPPTASANQSSVFLDKSFSSIYTRFFQINPLTKVGINN